MNVQEVSGRSTFDLIKFEPSIEKEALPPANLPPRARWRANEQMRPDSGQVCGHYYPNRTLLQAGCACVVSIPGVRAPPGDRQSQAQEGDLRIYAAGAPLDDEEAIMWLSALLPSPVYLRAIVEPPTSTHRLEEETDSVRFVRCVGRELYVFWVPDVTTPQAAAITAACEPIRKWSVEAFTAAVGRALNAKVLRMQ
jgi:hypothetical protein